MFLTLVPQSKKAWKKAPIAVALVSVLALAGCDDDDDGSGGDMQTPPPATEVTYTYQVTVTNLTQAQPFSPTAAILHQEGQVWQVGQPASVELETQAEGGDNSSLLALFTDTASSEGILMPGQSTTFDVSINNVDDAMLTLSTMLVNTNDAFVGLNAKSLAGMNIGDSMTMNGTVYDAGTEANSEQAGTIPGPADGGTGYDATRDDVDFVAMHPGVVSQDDGLSTSVLTQAHRFDNPAVQFTVSRTE